MTPIDAYRTLEAQERRIGAIRDALAVLRWDQAVMMPAGGAAARAEQMATLGVILHEHVTAPGRADLIADAEADGGALDVWQRANLREIGRRHRRASAVPAALVEALARAVSGTEMAWRGARAASDFAAVAPGLEALLALVREEAGHIGAALGLDAYDALLDTYDSGLRMADIAPLFDELARAVPPLLDAVLDRQTSEPPLLPLQGPFPVALQDRLGRMVIERLGFDFNHGRLDVSHHPFSAGVPDDSRITTRYESDDFIQALMAVIHETGHSLYERGRPAAWRGQPVGEARGMVLHESQSLMFEMQAARAPAFVAWLAGLARETFSGTGPAWSTDNLTRHYHHVARGPIRVHADEVTYPLHIILRTRLERAMLAGELGIADLPAAWNEGMRGLLGIVPEGDAEGCLQDIHWYRGAFGYFPTYTLGAVAAAQLFRAARAAAPAIDDELADGRVTSLLCWAQRHVHAFGSLRTTGETIAAATGAPLGAAAFLAHLKARYLGAAAGALAGGAAAK